MTKKNSKRQNRSPIQKISIMSLVQRPIRFGSKRQNRIPIQKTSMIFGPAPEIRKIQFLLTKCYLD